MNRRADRVGPVSRRDQIQMTDEEVQDFLAEERTVVCATIGRDGWPHLMPLWYVVRDGEIWAWTFAKSQKAKNLERDARCTLQVEAGDRYEELRGVMIKARCEIHRDVETIAALGREVFARHSPTGELDDAAAAMVDKQAPKRIAMQFVRESIATWDHRKLGAGVY
jgi:nitroimidazol reductase NimA-like FMN-containing flavoprotein (pyridoxamine 5'-phosphate oxidase superfamily)